MIKIVPWKDRKLTKKNLAKIWNLFPDEEICMVDVPIDYYKLQWAKVIARYYVLRGKDFSIEIDPVNRVRDVEEFLKIGVKKLYFTWGGMEQGVFFSSMDTISYAINVVQNYKDVVVYIIYTPPYSKINVVPDDSWLETSIVFLSKSISNIKNIYGILRTPHPWYGNKRENSLRNLELIANQSKDIEVENKCGCLTIDSNTNIYCCPFCEKKKRKKFFGNADRDKFVCGTIDRGIFRDINCSICQYSQKAQKGKILYIQQEG